VLPACGSSDDGKPIPTDQANQMIALVRLADKQSADGTCNGAQDKVRRAQAVLDDVPKSVDRKVRQGLAESLDRLNSLIQSECQRPQKTQTETTPTDTTPTEPTQTQTETTTTPTTTTPTTTTPTTTTPTTPTTTTPTTTTPTTTGTDTGAGNGGAPSSGGNGGAQG